MNNDASTKAERWCTEPALTGVSRPSRTLPTAADNVRRVAPGTFIIDTSTAIGDTTPGAITFYDWNTATNVPAPTPERKAVCRGVGKRRQAARAKARAAKSARKEQRRS